MTKQDLIDLAIEYDQIHRRLLQQNEKSPSQDNRNNPEDSRDAEILDGEAKASPLGSGHGDHCLVIRCSTCVQNPFCSTILRRPRKSRAPSGTNLAEKLCVILVHFWPWDLDSLRFPPRRFRFHRCRSSAIRWFRRPSSIVAPG